MAILKPFLLSFLAFSLVSGVAHAIPKKPSSMLTPGKKTVKPAPVPAKEEDKIDAELAELNALINDSSLKPNKNQPAMLEDFKEELQLSETNPQPPATNDFAKNGGLQETPAGTVIE